MTKKKKQILLTGRPTNLGDIARASSNAKEFAELERATFERQMEVAREVMDRHKIVYSILAKGDASPYMTDELKADMEAAAGRLEKYKVKNRPTGKR